MRLWRRREPPDEREWAVGFTVEFVDGSPALSCVLGFNTRDRCEASARNLPGQVPYSGPRPVLGATFFACPTETLR